LRRKDVKFHYQHESTHILLFVAWKSEGYKKVRAFVHLIKHEGWCDWSEAKLEEYYKRYASEFCVYTGLIEDAWLMHDGKVLVTRLELDFMQRDGVLNIIISEGVEDEHTGMPVWVDPNM